MTGSSGSDAPAWAAAGARGKWFRAVVPLVAVLYLVAVIPSLIATVPAGPRDSSSPPGSPGITRMDRLPESPDGLTIQEIEVGGPADQA